MKMWGWSGWGFRVPGVSGVAGWLVVAALGAGEAWAQVATTTVQDTVTDASGAGAVGTVVVSWEAFTTVTGSSVAAGSLSETLGTGGALSIGLQPNAGATPMGSYYTALFHLSDGTTSREFWVVPVTLSGTVTLASIRNQVLPTSLAMQTVSKQYVDTTVAKAMAGSGPGGAIPYVLTGGDAMTGPLTLPGDPVSAMQAADKHYVDAAVAGVSGGGSGSSGSPTGAAGGDLSGTYPNPIVGALNGAALPANAAGLQTNSAGQLQVQTQSSFQGYLTAAAVAGVNSAISPSGCAFSSSGSVFKCGGSNQFQVDTSGNATTASLSTPSITTFSTALKLRETGDTLGAVNLQLLNRGGSAGAIFTNEGLDLVDFGFQTFTGAQNNFRFEHRSASLENSANTNGEFQMLANPTAGNIYAYFGASMSGFLMPVTALTYSGTNSSGASFEEVLYTPASSSAACSAGQFGDDANYHYVCVASNTWKRVALAAF